MRARAASRTLDLTGGAPELNPHFRDLGRRARALGAAVIDRCNLTDPRRAGPGGPGANFSRAQRVEVVASLPCYSRTTSTASAATACSRRASARCARSTRWATADGDRDLTLNLVYNPQGPSLPPPQAQLEADYKRVLGEHFGVAFNRLFTLANMPIQRFGSDARSSKGQFDDYMALLRERAPRREPRRA